MATIPGTRFAQVALSALTAAQVTLNPPTSGGGEGMIVAGMEKAGSALYNYALNVERKKMVAEVSQRKRMIDERGWLAREALTGDDAADAELMKKLEADISEISSSSGYVDVNETMGQYSNDVLPDWMHALRAQSKGIQSANASDQILYEAEYKLSIGDVKGYKKDLDNLARLDPRERTRVESLKAQAPAQSVLLIAQKQNDDGDYAGALKTLGRLDGMELTPDQSRSRQVLRAFAEKKKGDVSEALSNDVRDKIQQGEPLQNVLGMIRQQPGLDPDEKDTLAEYARHTAVLFGGERGDENDSNALAEAYKIIASDMNQQQKFEKLMSLKTKLRGITVDGFIKDIYEPETVNKEIYSQYSRAIGKLQTDNMFSSDVVKNINLAVKAQGLLRMFAKQHPNATEDEYSKFFNRLIENQTSFWTGAFTGKSFWNSLRRKKGEMRYSIPRNIETMQTGYKATGDLSSLSDEELLKRIMGK